MLANNVSYEDISKYMNISIEEINDIKDATHDNK